MASLRNKLIYILILLTLFFRTEFVRAESEKEAVASPKVSIEDLKKMNNKLVIIDSQIRELVISATCIEDDAEASPQQKIIYTKIEKLLKEGQIIYKEMEKSSAELSGKTRTLNRQKDLLKQFSDWGLPQQTFSDPRAEAITAELNARIVSLSAELNGADPAKVVLIQDEIQRAQCDAQDSIKKYAQESYSAAINPFGNINNFIKKRNNAYSDSGLEWIKLSVCNPISDTGIVSNTLPEIPCYKNDLQEKIQKAINIMYPAKKNTDPPKKKGSSFTEAGFSENQRNQNQAPGNITNEEGAYGYPNSMGMGGMYSEEARPEVSHPKNYPASINKPKGTR